MKSKLYTWGTGAAWGRDLGCLPTDKKARNHTSLSILAGEGDSQTHFLIDVGAPCVESMIEAVQEGNVPVPAPQAVFITHSHYDHNADLTKLVFSRESGWIRRHLSSSYDWVEGYVPRPMTDTDWREICRDADFKDYRLEVDIAEDGNKYEI